MKTKFGIVGCGFLGNIVADAWKNGLLPDYELVGVTSRTRASAEKTAETVSCAVCDDVDALLALEPEYIVETASVEAVRAMAVPVLKKGVNLVIISIGAFADLAFYPPSSAPHGAPPRISSPVPGILPGRISKSPAGHAPSAYRSVPDRSISGTGPPGHRLSVP